MPHAVLTLLVVGRILPFSIENGGAVLNCAISLDGKLPISAEARVIDEPKLILKVRT